MKLDTRTNLYIASVATAMVVVAVASIVLWPIAPNTPHVLIGEMLLALVILAQRFPIRFQRQAEATLVTVPVFMAVLMVHPVEAVLISALGVGVAQRLCRTPVKAVVLNSGVFGLAAGAARVAWYGLGQSSGTLTLTPVPMATAAVAAMIQHGVNLGFVLGMISIRKGFGFLKAWSKTYTFEAFQEGGLLTLGLIGALLVAQSWWAGSLLVVPLVLARWGFERIVTDAAEKTQMAEELKASIDELKFVQAQLVQSAKLTSVGTLAAGVAHEINNPIFAISGRTELLLRGKDKHLASESAINDLQTIKEMTDRITTIVRRILEYSRTNDETTDFQVNGAMESAVSPLTAKFNSKNLEVEREFTVSPSVTGIENQIQQVFVNLIGNAVDAIPEWGKITLGCHIEDDMAVAYIKDNGVGIPKDIREKLFEPFFTTKEPGKGTGLGLFICHKILAEQGGEIGLDSEQGEGTTAWVKLPLSATASASPTTELAQWGLDPDTARSVALNQTR
ncbi:MAG: HAMP domain-containing sensor histidine kinase [SAR202 cluster bacterium]|nr:HAMP domain-containing sensor histidine kinase [SAR202 cluster bacterium]